MPPESPRCLTIEEAVALREATDPRPSPDGRFIAFRVGAVGKEGKHGTGAIYLVPSDGGAPPRPLTAGTALDAAPRWSPDGLHLAFVSDRHKRGRPALYLLPVTGGEARKLAAPRGEAADPCWSPDGTRIAFLLKEIDSKEVERRKKKRDDAIVVDDDKYTRLWVADVASGEAHCISPEGMQVWMHVWSPAGDRIAAMHSPTPGVNDYYNALTLSTLAPGPEPRAPSPWRAAAVCRVYGGSTVSLCWSPDGTRLAFVSGETQRPRMLSSDVPLVVAASGGEPKPALAGHPAAFSWVDWLSDTELAAAGDEGLRSAYYRISLERGEAVPLFRGGQPRHGSPRQLALSRDRGTLAFTREDTTSPGDVWAARLDGDPGRLTTLNPALETLAWGAVEEVSWTAPDGLEIQGLLIKPVGYEPGRRYPTVVHVHGGPAWLWSDRFYASWHDWDQLLAARGYAVLLPNPRGSTGRGTAFVRGNVDDYGGGEWQDVLAGARWAIESGIADPERMGLGGWSWGGYLTAWGVTQTDLFKAAVMGAGVSNLWSDHGQNNIPDMNLLYYRDLPYADPAPYQERSPMTYVARVKTPTLILHGSEDEIVAPPQAREFYRALRTLGAPAQLVLYPREPHSISERAHQLDLLRRVLAWFDTYLKP